MVDNFPVTTMTDWRTGMAARLAGAAVVGALTGAAALVAERLMPLVGVPINCHSPDAPGAAGCALSPTFGGALLGGLLWLSVVFAVAYGVGGLLGWLAGRLAGVRLGVTAPLIWPVLLLAIGIVLSSVDITLSLKSVTVIGYVALAYAFGAALTAPQLRPSTRVITTGIVVLAVVVSILMRRNV